MLQITALMIILTLAGCVTQQELRETEKRINKKITLLNYFKDHDRCFIEYNKCLHKNWDKKICWKTHTKCVISVHKMYQQWLDLTEI